MTYSRGRRRGQFCRWGPLRNHQSTWQQSAREGGQGFGMSQRVIIAGMEESERVRRKGGERRERRRKEGEEGGR